MAEKTPKQEELSKSIGAGLYARVEDFFSIMFQKVWSGFENAANSLADSAIQKVSDKVKMEASNSLKEIIRRQISMSNMDEQTRNKIYKELSQTTLADVGFSTVKLVGFLLGGFVRLAQLSIEPEMQDMATVMQMNIPDPGTLNAAKIKSPYLNDEVHNRLDRLGFDATSKIIIDLAARFVPPIDVIRLNFLRGKINEEEVKVELNRNGIDDGDITKFLESFWVTPGVQDVITMAVREVFSPDIAEKFGQYDEYPETLTEWGRKAGVKEEELKLYWAAHWQLPSIMQGFEMVHRGTISDSDLEALFVALDIMPYWRDKLKDISYNPYTRVDVRRMYNLGILDRTQVKRSYLDLGYNEEKSENMTEFTIRDAMGTEKELTKADILSSYKKKLINKEQASNYLFTLGYEDETIAVLLARIDYDLENEAKNNQIKVIKNRYLTGSITLSQAQTQLSTLALQGTEISALIEIWEMEKDMNEPILNMGELKELANKKIITKKEYQSELIQKGYSDKNVSWLVQAVYGKER